MKVTRVDNLDSLEAQEWNALVQRSLTDTAFQTYEWHTSWWKIFGHHAEPLLLVVKSEGEMVGIAPLMLTTERLFGRKLRTVKFMGDRLSNYADFIIARDCEEALGAIMEWLLHDAPAWDMLYLPNILNTAPTLQAVPAFFNEHGCLIDTRMLYEAPAYRFGDEKEDNRLTRRQAMRRHDNYFRKNGNLVYKNCQDADEILARLDDFFEQHIQRRAETDIPSQFLDTRQRDFYRTAARALAPQKQLRLAILLFNQIPIAFHVYLTYQNRMISYQPTFDLAYAKHSPGVVLLKYMLETAMQEGITEFDFSIGEHDYKYRYANHIRASHKIYVFRSRLPYTINRLLLDTRAFILRFPRLTSWGRRLLWRWRHRNL